MTPVVAQYLNHCTTAVPKFFVYSITNYNVKVSDYSGETPFVYSCLCHFISAFQIMKLSFL